jgi:hypothetical protein
MALACCIISSAEQLRDVTLQTMQNLAGQLLQQGV